jgi:hypothetical protein
MATPNQMVELKQHEWQTSLCSCCFDPKHGHAQCEFFCQSLFCQPCAQARLQEKAGLADGCCGPCCFYSFCSGSALGMLVPYCALYNLSHSVKEHQQIDEGCFCSLLKVVFCFPCTMNQIYSHFLIRDQEFRTDRACCSWHLLGCVDKETPIVTKVPQETVNGMQLPTGSNTMQPNSVASKYTPGRLITLEPRRKL